MAEQDALFDTPSSDTGIELLAIDELGRMLRARRGKLSLRQAADDAGVSFSTFSRVEAGSQPDLTTFTRLCAWLKVAPSRFFSPVAEREIAPLDLAIAHLRSDPRLPGDAAEKIGAVLRDLYAALAQEASPKVPIISCHLRAASALRPGVPQRLAAVLKDIHAELEQRVSRGEL